MNTPLLDGTTATLSLSTGANNNVGLTQASIFQTGTVGGAFNITGFSVLYDATDNPTPLHCLTTLLNNSGNVCTIKDDSGSSTTQHRILTGIGDFDIPDGYSALFVYDAVALRWKFVSMSFNPAKVSSVLDKWGGAATLAAVGTYYAFPDGQTVVNASLSETLKELMDEAGTIKGLFIETDTAPGTFLGIAQTLTVTVVKNGTDTALTATMTDTATSASDSTHTFAVVPTDKISIKLVASLNANFGGVIWKFKQVL